MAERKQTTIKGDKSRVKDLESFQNNWDEINWSNKSNEKKKSCDCEWHERQVCDKCQRVSGVSLKDATKV